MPAHGVAWSARPADDRRVMRALREAVDLVLPQECPGCRRWGSPLCDACAVELESPARPVVPVPEPAGWPSCWAGAEYAGAAAALLRAYKDGDRRDLAAPLARCLGRAVDAALTDPVVTGAALAGRLLVVPVPSSRRTTRRRGDRPVQTLARRALRGLRPEEARLVDAVALDGRVADQGGLGRTARRANLAGACTLTAAGRRSVPGRTCLVVDDVATTGSTVCEVARVLRLAGATEVRAAVALAPRWRTGRGPSADPCRPAAGRSTLSS